MEHFDTQSLLFHQQTAAIPSFLLDTTPASAPALTSTASLPSSATATIQDDLTKAMLFNLQAQLHTPDMSRSTSLGSIDASSADNTAVPLSPTVNSGADAIVAAAAAAAMAASTAVSTQPASTTMTMPLQNSMTFGSLLEACGIDCNIINQHHQQQQHHHHHHHQQPQIQPIQQIQQSTTAEQLINQLSLSSPINTHAPILLPAEINHSLTTMQTNPLTINTLPFIQPQLGPQFPGLLSMSHVNSPTAYSAQYNQSSILAAAAAAAAAVTNPTPTMTSPVSALPYPLSPIAPLQPVPSLPQIGKPRGRGAGAGGGTGGGRRRNRSNSAAAAAASTKPKPIKFRQMPSAAGKPRPFMCPHCGQTFRRAEHERRHIAGKHEKDRPHVCEYPGCGRAFTRSDNMKQHMKMHQQPKKRAGRQPGSGSSGSSTRTRSSTSSSAATGGTISSSNSTGGIVGEMNGLTMAGMSGAGMLGGILGMEASASGYGLFTSPVNTTHPLSDSMNEFAINKAIADLALSTTAAINGSNNHHTRF